MAKILRTTLRCFQIIQLCSPTLKLNSSLFTSLENHLLVQIKLSDQITSLTLLVIKTVDWRQVRDILRLERARCRIIEVSCVSAATVGRLLMLRDEILAVVGGKLQDLTLTLTHRLRVRSMSSVW